MPGGRLIVIKDAAQNRSAVYIVANPDSAAAVRIIRNKIAKAGEVVQDGGRISQELLRNLRLQSGQFLAVSRIKGRQLPNVVGPARRGREHKSSQDRRPRPGQPR